MAIVLPDPRFEMPELFIPGSIPLGPVKLVANHPLLRGLVTLQRLGPYKAIEYIKNGYPVSLVGTASYTKNYLDLDGSVANYAVNTSWDHPLVDDGDEPLTIAAQFFTRDIATYQHIVGAYDNATTRHLAIAINASGEFVGEQLFGGSYPVMVSGNVTANQWHTGMVSTEGRYSRQSFFMGNPSTVNTDDCVFTGTCDRLGVGHRFSSGVEAPLDGGVALLAAWSRALNDTEGISFTRDPYQLFEPA